jgi:putative sterol carrier protein
MGVTKIDLAAEPAVIYAAVTAMDADDFEELMSHPASRDRVIDVLVGHMAGTFRPEKAGDLDAVIHVKLWDKPGGGYDHRELIIRDGTCVASSEPAEEPRLTLKVRPTDLRAIVAGDAGPRRLALRGRLRVLGDLGLGMKLSELFDLSPQK